MEAAIATDELSKAYGEHRAVDRLTLTIEPGEVFGLLGPNGAGKTTTILMMLGLTEPTAGSVRVVGHDPTREPLAVKSAVGYVPDEVGFYDQLTARQNLRYTAELNRIRYRDARRKIDEVLADVGLTDVSEAKVGTFSRGMRQRLGLADALVKSPSVLILDEPTVNIDPEGVRELLALVERLRVEQQVTVVLSSHLLHQVQQSCDRIGIFVRGRLRACGTVDELAAEVDDRWIFDVGIDGVDDLGTALGDVDGITSIEPADGRWLVASERDVASELASAVHAAGIGLTHLSRQREDLDAIYRRYFDAANREEDAA